MLQRSVIQRLVDWKNQKNKRALLITGARQVGKTTAVRMFAAKNYRHFVEINFIKTPRAKEAFNGNLDTRTIFINLSAMGFGPFVEHETLVFFDEIQECPNARTAIKFLVEEQKYDYIESGSLLGINYKDITSYPVGFETELRVFPLDFKEFLWAKGIGEEVISLLADCYTSMTSVPDIVHKQMSYYWGEYLVVGGMPDVVNTYVSQNDFSQVVETQRSIVNTYRADIAHYADSGKNRVHRVFDAIPSQLGKQDKRFVLASLEKGASRRTYSDPTQWLIDAGLAYYSFNTKAFELPFEAFENRSLYKLYFVDTGLLCSLLLNKMQLDVLNGNIGINEGALVENAVADTFSANGISLHYYDRKSKHELDFIYRDGERITIVEVKSGKDFKRHTSLSAAMNTFGDRIAKSIVLCTSNVEYSDGVQYLPLYLSMFIG